MINFGAFNWFDSFIKRLKKTLVCINHVIYTCDSSDDTIIEMHTPFLGPG